MNRYVVRPLAWAVLLFSAVVLFLFLLWMAQGNPGPGPNSGSTLGQALGTWGLRVYVVGLAVLAALVIRRRVHRA